MISNHLSPVDEASKRIDQLLGYLEVYHTTIRAKPVFHLIDYRFRLLLAELPDHPNIRHPLEPNFTLPADTRFTLSIRRPESSSPPDVPDDLRPYVTPSADPAREPEFNSEILQEDQELEQRLTTHWLSYLEKWQAWALDEQRNREASRIYNRLYDLYRDFQREGESLRLVVCSGVISAQIEGRHVCHPLLMRDVELVFDPDNETIRLEETDGATTGLYDAILSNALGDQGWLDSLKKQLADESIHPLGGEKTFDLLRSLAIRLDPDTEFSPSLEIPGTASAPLIHYAPVILLRDKGAGYRAFVEAARRRVREGKASNQVLLDLVGLGSSGPREVLDADASLPIDILFARPANSEQEKAVKYLERQPAVLIQGPPGTGKTHTIANIIGHYLAHGRSILVTAHTAKALRVLRHHLPERLQSLCVAVLDSDARSKNELKSSVNEIARRLADDPMRLCQIAKRAEAQRQDLRRALEQKRRDLIDALGAEYRSLVIAGEPIDPISAAREVAEGIGKHDWIPDQVPLDTPCPLSRAEIEELYRLNAEIPTEIDRAFRSGLPDPKQLPAPDDFSSLVKELAHHARNADLHRPEDWERSIEELPPKELQSLRNDTEDLSKLLLSLEPWLRYIAGLEALQSRKVEAWKELVGDLKRLHEQDDQVYATLLRHDPHLPESSDPTQLASTLDAITAYLKTHGKIGFLKRLVSPGWRQVIEACRVAGRPPASVEEFEALAMKARLELETRRLSERWDRQVTPVGGPSSEALGGLLSTRARELLGTIERALSIWDSKWVPLQKRLRELGFRDFREEPPTLVPSALVEHRARFLNDVVAPKLAAAVDHLKHTALRARLREATSRIAATEAPHRALHPLVHAIREALRQQDVESYRKAYDQLLHVYSFVTDRLRRDELLAKLRTAAPGWANGIEQRKPPHDKSLPPGDPLLAWRWRQIHDELERRAQVDISQLNQEIRELEKRLGATTLELIESRTWHAQIERTGHDQRRALHEYVDAMKRYGKGTGKNALHNLRIAQNALQRALRAVPVWIMPLERVYETFVGQDVQFDLLIIDEASQCDPRALAAFTLAKKVLVVGDDEQVSPEAIGENLNAVINLINAHLGPEIPGRLLLDGKSSVYDIAKQSFPRQLRLIEHFRCVPEIIEFSNNLSYNGEIKPLRDSTDLTIRPFTVEHVVANGYMDDHINHAEAMEIVALIAAAIDQPEYKGKTFGVVTLLGNKQAPYIDKLLREHLQPSVIESRRILCGTPAHFQGDERDVVFLSLVESPREDRGPLRLFSEGASDAKKKRLNVAASRARDQLWVVHSLEADVDLKPDDLRRQLIMHVRNPRAAMQQKLAATRLAESEFERRVISDLTSRGFKLRPQYEVGYYRIDIVVYGRNGRKVAVECDGDRFHSSEEAIRNDYERQMLLERLGWQFIRIRGSQYFRDPKTTIDRVEQELRTMGVEPILSSTADQAEEPDRVGTELLDRVRRRARELLDYWNAKGRRARVA